MATATRSAPAAGKGLHLGLWAAQILLALGFGMAGGMKLVSAAQFAAQGMPLGLVYFIGVAEVAGALGLILPAATRIAPILTAWAGVGLATIMALAGGFHLMRGEASHLPPVVVLFALAAFVAWG